jgi:sulfur-carrier protein
MAVKVRIPTPLRKLTKEKEVVEIDSCATLGEMIESLEKTYPGIKERLCDEKGEIRRFINVYLNDEDIRFLKNRETPVKAGDEVSIVPAIAGG